VLGSSVPGAEVPASNKGVCTLEVSHGTAGDRLRGLAMPNQNTVPNLGKKCGRRERESRREGRRESKPFARDSFACRGGERHPDLLEDGALRGASLERGSRSVRQRVAVSSAANRRAGDSGCPEVAEEGNVVGMRHKAYAPITRTLVQATRGRVLHSVQRPVHVNPRYALRLRPGWRGGRNDIAVGQTHESGRNRHRGRSERTKRGSPRVTAFARKRRGTFKKRKEVEASVPARIEELGFGCSHVVFRCRSR
jgi:hypothetical protein